MIRKLFFAALALVCFALPGQAETWRMSTKQPADSLEGKIFQHFADLVGKYSAGKLSVQVFPSEQLGKTDAVLEQLQAGTIQIFAEDPSNLGKWAPDIRYVIAPFLFKSRDHWVRFMQGDLVQTWFKKVRDDAGITFVGDPTAIYRGPYRVLVSKRDVRSLSDLAGLKLRMYPDDLAVAAWRYLGAEPKVLAWTDTYEAIRTGVVEAVTSPVSIVEGMRFYEVANYVIRDDEFYQGIALMVNAKAYDGLTPALRAAVDKAQVETAAFSKKATDDATSASLARLKDHGVKFETLDTSAIVARMHDFYAEQQKLGKLPAGFLQAVDELH